MYRIFTTLIVIVCMVSSVRATNTAELLKISKKATIQFANEIETHKRKALFFSNDGRYLTIANYQFNKTAIFNHKYTVFNVEDSENPVLSGSYKVKNRPGFDKDKQYSRDGQLLISLNTISQIRIENSTRPEAPQLITTFEPVTILPSAFAVSDSSSFMALGDVEGSFHIYDLKEVEKPELISKVNTGMPINDIILSEDEKMGVILGKTAQFKIYNLTDTKALSLVTHKVFSNTTQFIKGALLGEGFKFLALQSYNDKDGDAQANEQTLLIYSVETPESPQLVFNSYENGSEPILTFDYKSDDNVLATIAYESIYIDSKFIHHAYAPDYTDSLSIHLLNMKDPTSPKALSPVIDDHLFTNIALNPKKNMLAAVVGRSKQVILYQYGEDEYSASQGFSEKSQVPAILLIATLAALLIP